MPVTYNGKTYSDKEVYNIINSLNEDQVKNLLRNVDEPTREAIIQSYNNAAGTNFTKEEVYNWAGIYSSSSPGVNTTSSGSDINISKTPNVSSTPKYDVKVRYTPTGEIDYFELNGEKFNPYRVFNLLETKSPSDWQKFLSQSNLDIQDLYKAYTQVGGNLSFADFTQKYFGLKTPEITPNEILSSQTDLTSKDILNATNLVNKIYEKYRDNFKNIKNPRQYLIEHADDYYKIIKELSKQYNVNEDYLVENIDKIVNWWDGLSTKDKINVALKANTTPYKLDFAIYKLKTILGKADPMVYTTPNFRLNWEYDLSKLASKYGLTKDELIRKWNEIEKRWRNASYEEKEAFAKQMGLTVADLENDFQNIKYLISEYGDVGSGGGGGYNYTQIPSTSVSGDNNKDDISYINPYLEAKTKGLFSYLPQIKPYDVLNQWDFSQLQKDLYEGMKNEILQQAEKELEKINLSTSKTGLFRSGLKLKLQEQLSKDTVKALSEAYGKAAVQAAEIKADMFAKQGDWYMAAQMQNVANMLKQEQINNEMQLGLLNAILKKYGIDEQVNVDKAKLALEKYGIEMDTQTKYDLEALEYLKSLNLARADIMTRMTIGYLQYASDLVKQAIAVRNWTMVNDLQKNIVLPLLDTLFPTIVDYVGGGDIDKLTPDKVQEYLKRNYGINVDIESIKKIIEENKKLHEQLNEKEQYEYEVYS